MWHRVCLVLMKYAVLWLFAALIPSANGECDPQWLKTFDGAPGTDDRLSALVVFDDGLGGGPAIYAGGTFGRAGGVLTNYVAKWDGERWCSLDGGMNTYVSMLAVFDDGSGPALYAGGYFTVAGGEPANRIAKWDGASWSPVGGGLDTGLVSDMVVYDDGSGDGEALYVAGSFTEAGGETVNYIAKWNGTTWSDLAGGMNSNVSSLAVFDDGLGGGPALYAGGGFTTAGGVDATRIAKWDGQTWSPLGSGTSDEPSVMRVFDDGSGGGPALYAGGWFSTAGGLPVNYIAKWDGEAWSALAGGMSEGPYTVVYALAVFDDGSGGGAALYAGGTFGTAGGVPARRIAKWDGVEWSPVGTGMDNFVHTLAVVDSGSGEGPSLCAGGSFAEAGDVSAWCIAEWDGATWSPLGRVMNDRVRALAVLDDRRRDGEDLYAGGSFQTAGGLRVNNVAGWDGSSWSALGNGVDGTVYALGTFDDSSGEGCSLYAGGDFRTAGETSAKFIARWDGSSWSALEGGLSRNARALTVFDDELGGGPALYVGGQFSEAGDLTVHGIARWDGAEWSSLGTGVGGEDPWVYALAVFDDGNGGGPSLFAGGEFTSAGGTDASHIARWDGTTWSSVGGGVDRDVHALAVFDDGSGSGPALYVGGEFITAGGGPASRIAKWDGETWSPVGTGVGGGSFAGVDALVVFDDRSGDGPALYAGGTFKTADGVTANRIAKWDGTAWTPLDAGKWTRSCTP